MAKILPFPTHSAQACPLAAPRDAVPLLPIRRPAHGMATHPPRFGAAPHIDVRRRRFMDLSELAEKLGLDTYERRTIITRLRLLHDQAGMPAPHTPRHRDGRLHYGAAAIWAGAYWDRGTILIWLDRPIGPGGAAAPAAAPTVHPAVAAGQVERLAARAELMLARKSA